MKDSILIFLHIAKTAGTTFALLLRSIFTDQKYFHANVVKEPPSILGVQRWDPIIKALAERPSSQEIKFVAGHISFGMHKYLSAPSTYITFVREPIDRCISSYFYSTTISELGPIETFFRDEYPSDYQTRVLSGVPELDSDKGPNVKATLPPVTEQHLEIAKAHLKEHFLIAAPVEQFDEALVLLKRKMSWKMAQIVYKRENVTKLRPKVSEIPDSLYKIMEEKSKFDQKLYTFVKERFQTEIQKLGFDFQIEVQLFRILNELYQHGRSDIELIRTGTLFEKLVASLAQPTAQSKISSSASAEPIKSNLWKQRFQTQIASLNFKIEDPIFQILDQLHQHGRSDEEIAHVEALFEKLVTSLAQPAPQPKIDSPPPTETIKDKFWKWLKG